MIIILMTILRLHALDREVCVYVCVYIYIYTYVCMCVYIYICIYITTTTTNNDNDDNNLSLGRGKDHEGAAAKRMVRNARTVARRRSPSRAKPPEPALGRAADGAGGRLPRPPPP